MYFPQLTIFILIVITLFAFLIKYGYLELFLSKIGNLRVKKYAKNRQLRRELSMAFGSKAFKNDVLDNQENVLKIANLRHERANLLGYKTHAHFILEERMAETPEKVISF